MSLPASVPDPLAAAAFRADLATLDSAEDFLDYFAVAYDPAVVRVNRLHILQRLHDYLGRHADTADHAQWQAALARAYADFVRSDALTEGVFRVFKRVRGIATVPLSSIGRRQA